MGEHTAENDARCMVCGRPATEVGDAPMSLHGSSVRERFRIELCATHAAEYHGPASVIPPAEGDIDG